MLVDRLCLTCKNRVHHVCLDGDDWCYTCTNCGAQHKDVDRDAQWKEYTLKQDAGFR